MKKRLLTAAVCIPLTIITLVLFDTFVFNTVVIALTLLAIHEALTAFHIPHKNVLFAGFVPVCCLYLFRDYEVIDKLAFPAAFFVLLFVTLFIFKYFEEIKIASVLGVTLFGAMIMFSFYSMIHFKIMFPPREYGYFGVLLILVGLAYAWGGDSMAYFVGRKFGKHKMSPKISPHKTIEGAAGGILGSILLGEVVLFVYYGLEQMLSAAPVLTINWQVCLLVAVIAVPASLLGMTGDLFASSVKRQMDIKDYGTILPGHGGILDRFDSIVFITPFLAMCASFFCNFLA